MTERDALFRDPGRTGPFEFDDEVARVLPDMLSRSIPGYAALLELIGVLARQVVVPNGRVYDLGCSLGAVSLAVLASTAGRAVEIVAVDSSPAMIERLAQMTHASGTGGSLELRCQDVLDTEIHGACLVVLNFTLQFVAPRDRSELIDRIARGLLPGGALVLSEKTQPEQPAEAVLSTLHDEFRRTRGYSDLEIARKRKALEDVLLPDTSGTHLARLEHAGLRPVEWFRGLGFVSWLASKPS
jgi:tRNA (cmo5U34)-methyltransferase